MWVKKEKETAGLGMIYKTFVRKLENSPLKFNC